MENQSKNVTSSSSSFNKSLGNHKNTKYSNGQDDNQKILLDSGNNEVEMLEFVLGSQSFGINVAKVQSVFQYDETKVTKVPDLHSAVLGVILVRNETIPLISLSEILNVKKTFEIDIYQRQVVILLSFNNIRVATLVDGINRIHRISWNTFVPIHEFCTRPANVVIGSFNKNNNEIMIIDYEKIMAEIIPSANVETLAVNSEAIEQKTEEEIKEIKLKREEAKVIHIDDSSSIRNIVQKVLQRAGYKNISTFENGHDAFIHLSKIQEKITQQNLPINTEVNIIVSDIEMPQMDGLTLCKKIRDELHWTTTPIVMFSSLIDEQMMSKCQTVGATTQLGKADIRNLNTLLDKLLKVSN
ncbi:MAG: chemotaxis protein CheV [Oligoflexia bacterium]|nr:chemotaxis protein CheV [Oligoflexia bacterium]